MEHTNEQNYHTERYLLGELSDEERRAYEEHFFNCQACGEDVAAAARMMAAGRRVAEEDRKVIRPDPSRWRGWVPPAVAASVVSASLGWFGAIQYVTQRAATVQPPPAVEQQVDIAAGKAYSFTMGQVRAAEDAKPQQIRVPAELNLDIFPHADAASFVWSIRNAKGETLESGPIRPEETSESYSVQLRALPRGSYQVAIEGVHKEGNRFPIASEPFEVIGER